MHSSEVYHAAAQFGTAIRKCEDLRGALRQASGRTAGRWLGASKGVFDHDVLEWEKIMTNLMDRLDGIAGALRRTAERLEEEERRRRAQ